MENFYRGYLIISRLWWEKKSLWDLELTLSWWFSIYISYDPINKVIKLVESKWQVREFCVFSGVKYINPLKLKLDLIW